MNFLLIPGIEVIQFTQIRHKSWQQALKWWKQYTNDFQYVYITGKKILLTESKQYTHMQLLLHELVSK